MLLKCWEYVCRLKLRRLAKRCRRSSRHTAAQERDAYVGGMDLTTYDVFKTWLTEQKVADVVILQELHWRCGKEETQWPMLAG